MLEIAFGAKLHLCLSYLQFFSSLALAGALLLHGALPVISQGAVSMYIRQPGALTYSVYCSVCTGNSHT